MDVKRQYCSFVLDGLLFGVEVVQVQEVLLGQAMTRVPLAPVAVRGLINLRGQIVTAIDLRRRLELPAAADGGDPMNVVVRTEDGAVSLLVDAIGDVVEVREESFEPPPATLTGLPREVTTGVYKLDHRLLLVLDVAKVLAVQNSSDVHLTAGAATRVAA